ncbi:MAG: hypothetical protein ACYDDF_10405 [Thermoplasmatota archaeon]
MRPSPPRHPLSYAGRALVGITAILLAGAALATAVQEISSFSDPCMSWGASSSGVLRPNATCPRVSATSETKAQAIERLLFFNGLTLAIAGVALWGAVTGGPGWMLYASMAFLLFSFTDLVGAGLLLGPPVAALWMVGARLTWCFGARARQVARGYGMVAIMLGILAIVGLGVAALRAGLQSLVPSWPFAGTLLLVLASLGTIAVSGLAKERLWNRDGEGPIRDPTR